MQIHGCLAECLMAIGLLVILVLIIYLIDRVNTMERETRQVLTSMHQQSSVPTVASPFLGLSSKKLWDAMTGRPEKGLDLWRCSICKGPTR